MQHRIILPGATTLTRLISEVREKATLRLWNKLNKHKLVKRWWQAHRDLLSEVGPKQPRLLW